MARRRKLELRLLACLCQKYTGAKEGEDIFCNRCGDWMTVGIPIGKDAKMDEARQALPIDPPF